MRDYQKTHDQLKNESLELINKAERLNDRMNKIIIVSGLILIAGAIYCTYLLFAL